MVVLPSDSGAEHYFAPGAYPVPVDIKPRVLSTAITMDDSTASLDLAYEVAEYFDLSLPEARRIAAQAGKAAGKWRTEATKLGLAKVEIDRMASAFEHEDLHAAIASRRHWPSL